MCPECPGIRATQPSPVEVGEDPTSPKHTLEPTGFTHRNVLIYPQKWSYYNAQIHTSTICSTEKTESTREKVSLEAPVHQGKVGCPEMGTPTAQPPAPLAGRPGPKHTVSSRIAHGHTRQLHLLLVTGPGRCRPLDSQPQRTNRPQQNCTLLWSVSHGLNFCTSLSLF